jgi:hypothetical protein
MFLGFRNYWSLSGYVKHRTKRALSVIKDFEIAALNAAKERGHAGVI